VPAVDGVRVRARARRWLTPAALAALTLAGLVVRLWVLRINDELNSDEVLPGLMALHIARGQELPVFFYGQHYFGALEAYLIAGLFKLFGFRPWLIVAPALAASLALIPITYALGARLAGPTAGLLATLPLAVPPPIAAKLFTNSGGGFSLAFALHGAALLCFLRAFLPSPGGEQGVNRRRVAQAALFSFLSGLLCWIWQPALPLYAVLLALLLGRWRHAARRRWRTVLVLGAIMAPALPGLVPPLLYNVRLGWPTLAQLAVKYVSPANEAASGRWTGPGAVASFLLVAFGGGNEAEGGANPFQAALVAASFPLAALLLAGARRDEPKARPCPSPWAARWQAAGVLALAAAINLAAAHNTVRHLMPVALIGYVFFGAAVALGARRLSAPRRPAAFAAIDMSRGTSGRIAGALALAGAGLLVMAPNLWLDYHAGRIFRRFTASTAEVRQAVDALAARGLTTGYSDYWSAYPIIYFAAERIILAPSLPTPWGGRFDRYPPYTRTVDQITDPGRLFLLLDARCPLLPYVLPLEQAGAGYTIERLARWVLIWGIAPPAGAEGMLLTTWRQPIFSRRYC
jgi:hypothetical protein